MSDSESIKKMLRAVLQSSKTGVSITSLQTEYKSLCGEIIPLKNLGFSKLEDYLKSIPSVVRLEYRMGELKCFATVCEETAHIAELVAKQKSSKKSGRPQIVNCRMRFKPSNPYMLNVNSRSTLRQPSAGGAINWAANRSRPYGGYRGFSATGDYRQFDQKLGSITPLDHRQPAQQQTVVKKCVTTQSEERALVNAQKPREKSPERTASSSQSQSSGYDVKLEQTRLSQLLEKYYSGLWMSKLSEIYSETFNQKLHPQVLMDLQQWTQICMVEQPSSNNKVDRLIYPPLSPKQSVLPSSCPSESPLNSSTNLTITTPSSFLLLPKQPFSPLPLPKTRVSPKNPLAKPTFIFPKKCVAVSSSKSLASVTSHSPPHNQAMNQQLPPCVKLEFNSTGACKANQILSKGTMNPYKHDRPLAPTWTCSPSTNATTVASSPQPGPDILPLLKVTFSTTSDSAPSSKPSTNLSTELCQRIKELLSKYSQGIWAHALPKLFMDTYKTPFPEHILDNLSLYLHIWNVEYPVSHNKKKAILYNACRTEMEATDCEESQQCRSHPLPSGLQVLGNVVPPCLVFPTEQFPSVLVTDAKSANTVTIRYVGENYSNAQETMEDSMRTFYSQSSSCHPLPNPVVGQVVAIRVEDGDELARAQVMEIMSSNRVKVYYLDYGFSLETSGANLLELHQDFLSFPFQATNVRLAGLEAFSSHPLVLSCLEQLAVSKILLMERLEPCELNEMPLAVLYDTSQDEDININSACLKALQDETMNNPLTVNATYEDVGVTNICADGIICCQLPSRGTARLGKLLQETEALFIAQMSPDPLVSRPFVGKICLARYKGQWSRVEITNMYGTRVIDVLFIDIGVSATIEITDLREIPPLLMKDFAIIPPQAIKCRLADIQILEGELSPEVVRWLKETVLGSRHCKMKIVKLDEYKGNRLVYMYLFTGNNSQELNKSINHQLANSELWYIFATQRDKATISNTNIEDTGLSALVEKLTLDSSAPDLVVQPQQGPRHVSPQYTATICPMLPLQMPPPLELPQPGHNMDVFVPVACHPGYFVLQPWQDLHKLEILMGEMILHYNQMGRPNTAADIQKGELYAAKIDKNWHRVQVKGILANGLVAVYELDHGKHELVRSTLIRPLIKEFRHMPFQAITAQLAGVNQHQWSEEACLLFRNHVEKRALVAHVESVQALSEIKGGSWERKLTVYLVDTTMEERDLWIHNILADIGSEWSSAA